MLPVRDDNHVAEGVALLTSRYNGLPVITGLVTSCMQRLQQIEASFWDMIAAVQLANHPMAGGPWDVLDKLGSIVGVLRNGLADVDYLALIKLQIQINRSRGAPEDVIGLGKVMAGVQPPGYLEMPTAAFYLVTLNVAPASLLQFTNLLKQARAASVYGLLVYTTWAPGNDNLWSSRYGPTVYEGSWGSRYDGTVGGKTAAALQM